MDKIFHSVRLDEDKCKGCTNCIKRCPTEAIRVRDGKAYIISERCIDCGECIRICPHHAKRAHTDRFNKILDYKYRIALPAPTLYGQFNNLEDVDYVLTALKSLGFDDAFEVSRGAELVSEATRNMMNSGELKRPVISSMPCCLPIDSGTIPEASPPRFTAQFPDGRSGTSCEAGGSRKNRTCSRGYRSVFHHPLSRKNYGVARAYLLRKIQYKRLFCDKRPLSCYVPDYG